MKRFYQISFVFIALLTLLACKNAKQKLQEYVANYNKTAVNFKAKGVRLTTARGYINDDKIELRFETAIPQNDANKVEANMAFPKLLKELINKDEAFKDLVNEGVQFDVYYLADDNTVFVKQIVNKESIGEVLK